MSFIDKSYFVGEILITNKDHLQDVIQQAIDQYEKEILISLLGYKLYNLMLASPDVEPYKSLIEGAEFDLTFEGEEQTLKWEGFKNSARESLCAYYTYYYYQKRTFVHNSGVGTVKAKAANAGVVSPYPKMVQAWNNMITLYGYFPNIWFKYRKTMLRPDGGLIFNNAPSAYNYLCANISDFPDWFFTPIKPINPYI